MDASPRCDGRLEKGMSSLIDNRKSIDPFGRIGGKKSNDLIDRERYLEFNATIHQQIPMFVSVHQAWLLMLTQQGIVERPRAQAIMNELVRIDEHAVAEMIENWTPSAWEPMVQLEHYLTAKVGQIASDLNIARTIPPPFYRMGLLHPLLAIIEESILLLDTLLCQAELHDLTVMPGYTHFQHAQPMTYGHYLVGLFDPLARALCQIEAAYSTTNQFELGCGALSGTSFPVDRHYPAELLGFDGVVEHTNDAVAATDFLIDTLSALTNIFVPLSRVANDLDIWSTSEFGMVEIADEISNPSSMMPQKKNPAVFEFCRRTVASILGAYSEVVCGSHATQYGDVTEMRELSFAVKPRLIEATRQLRAFRAALDTMIVKKERMLELAATGFSTATELAAVLYREAHIPLRMAHGVVADAVRQAVKEGKTAQDITPEILTAIIREVTGQEVAMSRDQINAGLDPVRFVQAHRSEGGVAPEIVRGMIRKRRAVLAEFTERQALRTRRREDADAELACQVRALLNGSADFALTPPA
ncbi:MAG: argininosuccinate lyase [Spirochaetaceae bacterium]|nr:MAG: argininosuccinate lyase [Spirochaetaceae bacterium]